MVGAFAVCKQCRESWRPRVEHPLRCIFCGSREWNGERRHKGGARGKFKDPEFLTKLAAEAKKTRVQ